MIKLYHLDPDADWLGGARNGAKIVIALHDLGLEHEILYISRKRDMRDPASDFRKRINPWGTVPVIDHDGFVLRESAAILRYLADLNPESDLWPRERRQRATVDLWLTWEGTMLVPSLLNVVRIGRYDGIAADQADRMGDAVKQREEKLGLPGMAEAEERWHQNLQILEAQLAGREYVADGYSIADIALGCVAPLGTIFGIPLTAYANIVSWLRRLGQRPNWSERTFVLDVEQGKKAGLIPCAAAERATIKERRWAPY